MRSRRRALRKVVLLLDGVIIVAAMVLSLGLHTVLRDHVAALQAPPAFEAYANLAYLTLPLFLVLIAMLRLHDCFERTRTRTALFLDLIKLHVLGLVGLAVTLFITQAIINRSLVAIFMGCTFTLLYFERALIGAWLQYQYRRGHGRARVLLVGEPGDAMRSFVAAAKTDPFTPELIGYVAAPTNVPASQLSPVGEDVPEVRGGVDDIASILHEDAVDEVLFFPPFDHPDRAADALRACEELGVPARFAIDMGSAAAARPRVETLYERPFISFELAPKQPEALAFKHGFDTVAALVGVILLSPVFLVVALLVLITMGRPVFFLQERVGRYGRRFKMIKFRTMVKDAEARKSDVTNEMSGPVFKATSDPRVTRLGRFLRRSSIDELPQLFNVIGGSMSLVGPRPLPVQEQQQIRGWQRRRLSMKPGITGLWQVSGRSGIDFDDWMVLDLRYVDEWSLGRDLVILVKTLPAVLFRKGAK